ncbi:peptide chain release factor N(5)-glutamine methyltransferase [Ferruginibacter paludis]|uniref:peptide chain release factor N(5)-glutamine methyltransferase n=1 Tax=Ferruginibacter paludis TaxID=1310417 RepID=UPI0025B5AF25|nr:peptide chain release factor N(5)-glutamine methyltransferase [Ferruginibacter paludis]MDN3658835.1 peptide chain release factor N(5)-glutamine methyltransferase [Ferruginibacter paludis]
MFAKMTISKHYRNFLQQLQTIFSLNEATVITDWVFESLAGIQRFEVIKNPELLLSPLVEKQLDKALAALLQHTPVQYVLGEAWFYRMKLTVNEHVLIPRPETEELVQLVLDQAKINNTTISILDIGTGSGCIAIAIKKNMLAAGVTAIDVSMDALKIARQNASAQRTDIDFLAVDFLDENQWDHLAKFDCIVSNPPYIPLNEKDKLDINVTAFEPHQALFVPDNLPLLFYEKIAVFGKTHLNPNGTIFMETHEDFAKETAALFARYYKTVLIKKDLFGKERMVTASFA